MYTNMIFFLWRLLKTNPLLFLFLGGLLGTGGFPPIAFPLCWFFSLSILLSFLWNLFLNIHYNHSQPMVFFLPALRKTWFWFFGFYIGTLHWIANSFWTDPWSYGWFYPFVLFFIPGLLSLYGCIACGITLVVTKVFHRYIIKIFLLKTQGEGVFFLEQYSLLLLQIIFPFLFSFFYISQEWIKGHNFLNFPWNLTAYIWSSHLSFAQGAYYLGSYGLGHITLILLCFFWLSVVFFQKEYGQRLQLLMQCWIINAKKYSYGHSSCEKNIFKKKLFNKTQQFPDEKKGDNT